VKGTTGGNRCVYSWIPAILALSDRKDRNHKTASAYLEDNVYKGARFVLGRNVLMEYIDGVTKRIGKQKVLEELHNIQNSKLLVIEPVSKVDWDLAGAIMVPRGWMGSSARNSSSERATASFWLGSFSRLMQKHFCMSVYICLTRNHAEIR
jgi:hypothetical protein